MLKSTLSEEAQYSLACVDDWSKTDDGQAVLTVYAVLTSGPSRSDAADIPNFWESARFRVSKGGLEPPRSYDH